MKIILIAAMAKNRVIGRDNAIPWHIPGEQQRFKDKVLFVSTALKLLPVGLEETDDGIWSLHFNHVLLGKIDERDLVLSG